MIETSNILIESLSQALETMAFLTVIQANEKPEPQDESILVQIDFNGSVPGSLQILVGKDLAYALAENMSGQPAEDEAFAVDALKEFANVTCGLLLPMLVSSDDDSTFDRTIPKAVHFSQPCDWQNFAENADAAILDVEDMPMIARLVLKQEQWT